MTDNTQRPYTIRDGSLKASTWENKDRDQNTYYTTTLAKTYTDQDGNPRDTQSFSQNDLLRVAELARESYGMINDLRRDQKQSQAQQQEPQLDQNRETEREAFKEQRREQSQKSQDHGIQR